MNNYLINNNLFQRQSSEIFQVIRDKKKKKLFWNISKFEKMEHLDGNIYKYLRNYWKFFCSQKYSNQILHNILPELTENIIIAMKYSEYSCDIFKIVYLRCILLILVFILEIIRNRRKKKWKKTRAAGKRFNVGTDQN